MKAEQFGMFNTTVLVKTFLFETFSFVSFGNLDSFREEKWQTNLALVFKKNKSTREKDENYVFHYNFIKWNYNELHNN